MKLQAILLILLFSNCLFAQQRTVKKETYFDENGSRIGVAGFTIKCGDYKKYASTIVSETDSTITQKIVFREVYGILQPTERETIVKVLQQLTGKTIDANQTIVINFFFNEPDRNQAPSIDYYASVKKYQKYFAKHTNSIQFFMTEKNYDTRKPNVIIDAKGAIRNLLFKDNVQGGNYIIIKPNGRYYRRVGEYRQDEIPDRIKAEW